MRINLSTSLIATAALCCMNISGCKKDEDNKKDESAPQELQGDWASDCIALEGGELFQKRFAVIEGYDITIHQTFYPDNACTETGKLAESNLIGTYMAGPAAVSQTTVTDATSLDILLTTYAVRPANAAGVDLFQDICPDSEWVSGTYTIINAEDCGSNLGGLGGGKTFHTIYRVTDDQKLYIGDVPEEVDVSNANNRVSDLGSPLSKI